MSTFYGPICKTYCIAYKIYKGSCKGCHNQIDFDKQKDEDIQALQEKLMKDPKFLEDAKKYYTGLKKPTKKQLQELEEVNKALVEINQSSFRIKEEAEG